MAEEKWMDITLNTRRVTVLNLTGRKNSNLKLFWSSCDEAVVIVGLLIKEVLMYEG